MKRNVVLRTAKQVVGSMIGDRNSGKPEIQKQSPLDHVHLIMP
jgi:hypothetical protein